MRISPSFPSLSYFPLPSTPLRTPARSNEHVGQGGGSPHYHGDPFGPKCSYGPQNYTDLTAHPPLIGFSLDGGLIYGRHLSPAALGYSTPLDLCGAHSHDGLGLHYHAAVVDAFTDAGAQEHTMPVGTPYPLFTPGVFQCWRGNISALSDFWS